MEQLLTQTEEKMKKTLERFNGELATLRTGRANPKILENVKVEAYNAVLPLNQVATIRVPESRILEIQAWDVSLVSNIEKSLLKSDLGLTPNTDGGVIRMILPPLSEERRKELVRFAKKVAEEHRVSIRNERRDAFEALKKAEKDKMISEDQRYSLEQKIQKLTDAYTKHLDTMLVAKEKEVLEV